MSDKGLSKELSAMVEVEQALSDLSDDERTRVLTWASSKFGIFLGAAKKTAQGTCSDAENEDSEGMQVKPEAASTLAEFYDLAGPTSDGEKVLVVGYWFQYREGAQELDSQSINFELKHLGHGIGNVTRALEWHKSQKPSLMVQKRKEGTTKQARKKFAVTNEGKKFVEKMIRKGV